MKERNSVKLLSIFLISFMISLSPMVVMAEPSIMVNTHYVSPDATPSGFPALIVGTVNNFDLLILKEGLLERVVLEGIEIPKYDWSRPHSRALLALLRSTIGSWARIQKISTEEPSSAYVWISIEDEVYLLQSIIVSSGLAISVADGEIELRYAEEYASKEKLGIWADEANSLESRIEEDYGQEDQPPVQDSSVQNAKLVISEIKIFDNGEYALIVLAAEERGSSEGYSISIVSKSDRSVDEDVFFFASGKEAEVHEQITILVTLDRSRTVSYEYDFVWESFLDPRGGYLGVRAPSGSETLFEYEYDRRISGFIVTPLN